MFAHLHLHTQYSLLDGACTIEPLLDRIKELKMRHVAITDHGVMYGVVDFFKAALLRGIHPVIGSEVYVCADMDEKQSAAREYSHLVLLCENMTGYKNLMYLVSQGFTRGFYYKPRIDYALLREHAEGLIGLSACLSGDIPKLLLDGREREAREMARMYASIFGPDNFFIEIQDHGMADDRVVTPRLIALAREMELPLVATNDCHYISAGDAQAQEVLMCIQTGKTLGDTDRMRMETDQLYVKSEDEMRSLFAYCPEAIDNTEKIAERCDVTFDFTSRHLPRYPLPDGVDAGAYLRKVCEEGFLARYGDRADARARMEYELSVVHSMGFDDYFLIVWDFIRYAREHGILVGPGRGSGAGSVVAYSLGITGIDPLQYNLLFERFLNPERISMPDIDIDFDYERRGEVIEYVAEKYGRDHVAQIITFGTMAARAVLRDVGRVLGMTYQQVDQVAKMVPFALDMTLSKALTQNPELRRTYENDETVKKLVDTAKKLEGMPRHASTHAAGVLITRKSASEYVPLQTNDDVVTTQFPMNTLEQLGLLKMDFLGLRTLTVIGDSLEMLKAAGGPTMVPEDIPLNDPAVYKMISDGDTDGVFQLEGAGMRQFLSSMKPENFEDIIAAISLYRPGPMESIPRYIEGKHHPETVTYAHPSLKPILDVTYGCMVYQEQVMQIVRDLAGYSMGRSDLVRRAMSKKKHDVMAKEKEYFIHGRMVDGKIDVPGAVRLGVPEEVAERLFEEMTAFASYAFNKSHAAAYGVVAVQTAWLKRYYPAEFMAAMMNSFTGNADKVAYYIQHLRRLGISVLPPDVNISSEKFSVDSGEKKAVRFGMGAVKNVGRGTIRAIVAERERGGPYKDLYDFADRVPGDSVTKRAVECLIKSGAMDSLPGYRYQKILIYEQALEGASRRKKSAVEGQLSLFDFGGDDALPPPQPLPKAEEYPSRKLLSMEKEVTGVYITGHPLDEYREELTAFEVNTRWLNSLAEEREDHGQAFDGLRVQMAGIVVDKKPKATRSGGMMAFLTFEDLYGSAEALVFPKVYEKYGHDLEPDALLILGGKLSVREEEAPKLLLDSVRALTHGAARPEKVASPWDTAYGAPPDDPAAYEGITWEDAEVAPPEESGLANAAEYGVPTSGQPNGFDKGLNSAVGRVSVAAGPQAIGTQGVEARPASDRRGEKAATGRPLGGSTSYGWGSSQPNATSMASTAVAVSAARGVGKLYLKVNHQGQRDAAIPILRRTPGDIQVLFYHADENKVYAAPRELWVGDKVDIKALKVLLGSDRVVLK